MGLDMYAFSVPKESMVDDLSYTNSEDEKHTQEISYWRKHHDLHGWMRRLFLSKGGEGSFNCQPVRLTLEDLDKLEDDVRNNRLPETTGFFFGHNPPTMQSVVKDIEFIEEARDHIHRGREVYYDSWW